MATAVTDYEGRHAAPNAPDPPHPSPFESWGAYSRPLLWFNRPVRRMALSVSAMVVATVVPAAAEDPAASSAPRFVEEVGAIDHRYAGDFQYFVGGGVAVFDCDDDGRSELYFAGGSEPAALYHNDSASGGPLRFTVVPSTVTDLTAVTGAYPIAIDDDEHVDLMVLRVGEDVILRGLGDCSFEHANQTFGFEGGDTWTVAFSAKWEPGRVPADAGTRRLPRGGPRGLREQPAVPPELGCRHLRLAGRPLARLLHPVGAVQRLGPLRTARPAG